MLKKPNILELDFGMGNIRSLQKAFEHVGANVDVVGNPDKFRDADAIIIPGDGAFGAAMENLKACGFVEPIHEFIKSGKPVLGVCIGFQLLFEDSEEFATDQKGLSVFNGTIKKFEDENLSIPHMGWNKLSIPNESRILNNIKNNQYFYFVHSYCLPGTHPNSVGQCNYGIDFTAAVERDNVFAVQFHPEKSHAAGLHLIENFIEVVASC